MSDVATFPQKCNRYTTFHTLLKTALCSCYCNSCGGATMAPRSVVYTVEKSVECGEIAKTPRGTNFTGQIVQETLDRVIRIHGKWYNVRDFKHPGGPVALSLGFKRDATVLFESCHPFTQQEKLRSLLDKYRVSDDEQRYLDVKYAKQIAASSGSGADFDFEWCNQVSSSSSMKRSSQIDAFEADVKQIARSYFEKEAERRGVSFRDATKATPARWAEIAVLTAAFVISAAWLVQGWWPALVITPTVCWLWMVNFWHDAAHFALSSDWRVNSAATYIAPWFSSVYAWHHQHTIGHHAYTNIPNRDPDLYHAPAFWRFSKSLRWRSAHGWQALSTPLLWTISVPTLLILKPLVAISKGSYNRAVMLMEMPPWRIALHVLGRLAVAASLYAWPWWAFPESAAKAAAFAFVPMAVYSLWFMAASQVNHHDEALSDVADPRWYRHQAATSHTIAPDSRLAFLLSGGLNLQIEHHLLPCVNQCHLRALQPAIEAAARRHGVPYLKSATIPEAFRRLWRHLDAMGQRPAADADKAKAQ